MAAPLHKPIPRDKAWDSTLALLSEGYTFISRRCARHDTDIFETRLKMRPVFCALGEDAARVFFHPGRFSRHGAIPPSTMLLLQDRGSVQWLDDDLHRERKALFMAIMGPEHLGTLIETFVRLWRAQVPQWASLPRMVLQSEMEELLCRSVCEWAGVPLAEGELRERTRELAGMIDGAGAMGPRNWRGLVLRGRTERWARVLLEGIRRGTVPAPPRAARALAAYRDRGGAPLRDDVAVVELINILRPAVAISRYITFAAHALHEHPECARRVAADEPGYLERFVQEVRRFYPYVPALAGRSLHSFEWRGRHFPRDTWMLLDLYGTMHDPRLWNEPGTFDPDRFAGWQDEGVHLIAQGGGAPATGHRCAGEEATVELVEAATLMLATEMTYDVPPQDLSIDLRRMPAIPASRFVMTNVRPADAAQRAAAD